MSASEHLTPDQVYTRKQLIEQFEITDATINNGIFPYSANSVWLFVTEKKQSDRTQYRDLLDGDDLEMDGQTLGRTDHFIINHQTSDTELLLFYRKKKYEYPGAGFRYEGVFDYVFHEGSKPSHFYLWRRGAPRLLAAVSTAEDVRESLVHFAAAAAARPARTLSLVRSTRYWVHDPVSGIFGPSKFLGYVGMDFSRYEWAIHAQPTNFDGHKSQLAIVKALGGKYRTDALVANALRDYFQNLLGPGVFDRVDEAKWQFIDLPLSDEKFVLAVDDGGEKPTGGGSGKGRGQGYAADAEVRDAIEKYSMDMAKNYLRRLKYNWTDVSANSPYDLRCGRRDTVLHVEVKGTQSPGEVVLLTRNEVDFARENRPNMALLIVHSLKVVRGNEGIVVSGGEVRFLTPWDAKQDELEATAYRYFLPPDAIGNA